MADPTSPTGANGKKRTHNGHVKTQNNTNLRGDEPQAEQISVTEPTPPGAQPHPDSSKSSEKSKSEPDRKKQKLDTAQDTTAAISQTHPAKQQSHNQTHQKRPRLPNNTKISKRPLLHPAAPSPFSSSDSPKTLYITASSPYIPIIKRVRKFLTETSKRAKQSLAAHNYKLKSTSKGRGRRPLAPSGRLAAADVEREIAEGAREKGSGKGGGAGAGIGQEEVFLKASGKAIPRALEIGVHFQGEDDCRVRVEMGSVSAIDDIEVLEETGREEAQKGKDGGGGGDQDEIDIPETRIRTLSSITVAISLK